MNQTKKVNDISTYNELVTHLHLEDTYTSKEALLRLKEWCLDYVSSDLSISGDEAFQYQEYHAFVKDYFTHFKNHVTKKLDKIHAEWGDLNLVQYAAFNGYDHDLNALSNVSSKTLNEPTRFGMRPLHLAALNGYVQTLQVLLKKGADSRFANQQNQYPIHSSLMVPIVYDEGLIPRKTKLFYLLQEDAPELLVKQDISGDTVAHFMAASKFDVLLQSLVNTHHPALYINNNFSKYPIHVAILNQQLINVIVLMTDPEIPKQADAEGRKPIHYAAKYAHIETLTACLTPENRFIDEKDGYGKTPLMIAVEANNLDAVALLVRSGADVSLLDSMGKSASDYATFDNRSDVEVLLRG